MEEKIRVVANENVVFHVSKFGEDRGWINMMTGNASIYTSMSKNVVKELIDALQKINDELVEEK